MRCRRCWLLPSSPRSWRPSVPNSRDRITPAQRSRVMSRIRSKHTAPEMLLRRELWRRGFRYRLHQRIGKARPDLVFRKSCVAVFIDGCFWHGCPAHYIAPVGNAPYWSEKIVLNQSRDLRNNAALAEAGWLVVRLWECEVKRDSGAAADVVAQALREARMRGQQDVAPAPADF
jgi:DNA mismatch endonuclease, patch repair protein